MRVTICIGSACHLKGSREIIQRLQELVKEHGVSDKVDLNGAFCSGNCVNGVCVTVDGELFSLKPETIDELFCKGNFREAVGMAIIDFKATKCRHCYKCVRNCEVKAIMVKDGRAEIMPENCILCGRCLQICPQSAKTLVSDLSLVKGMVEAGEKVVISIAPSYMGLLKYHTIGQVRCALMRLGFTDVRETAEGAALVTAEYAKLLSEGTRENIISTCCPSVNALIEKYYPQLIPYLAPVVSPMIAHGRMIKQQMGADTRVVFLGPVSQKNRRRWIRAMRTVSMQC